MSTNNQLSGQAQEDVKTASDIHVTHKLPSEVEQRFDDGFIEHVQLNEYGDWDVLLKNEPGKMYQFIATEQVALLTRVLGLIGEDEHVGLPTTAIQEERNNYKKERNKVRRELRSQVQAIIKEYEV